MTWFGSYEVLYELRSGGMGKVLLARRRGPGGFEKLVAIKTIRTDLAASAQLRAMFLDEAAILAQLSHPAVATVHDFGEIPSQHSLLGSAARPGDPWKSTKRDKASASDGALYLVMEYVAGVSLHHLVGRGTPPLIAAQIVAEACRGIHAAHELRDLSGQLLGVVHRDISPDNVLIDFDGHVKVIDFGIALMKGRQAAVTEMGMLKGKPPYMSPEQIKSEAIDRRSDMFSLAVVLWELLTGQALFGGDSLYAIARAVEDQPIAAPSTVAGPLPPGLDDVVLRGLARDPAARFATAAEMATNLEAIVAAQSGEPLELYCARTLADQRESHRQWLAGILGGTRPVPLGRRSGEITAVAELPLAPTANVPIARVHSPAAGITPAPEQAPEVGRRGATRRRRFVAIASLAALAAVAAIGWRALDRARPPHDASPTVAASGRDGDTAEIAPPAEPVAALVDAGADAALVSLTLDEGDLRPGRRDIARRRVGSDARGALHRRDAAAIMALPVEPRESTSAGIGYLKVTAHPFAYVSIDGGTAVSTPILKSALEAGSHNVVLTDPSSGNRLLERTVTIVADQLTTVSLP